MGKISHADSHGNTYFRGNIPQFEWADFRPSRTQPLAHSPIWIRNSYPGLTPSLAGLMAEMHFGQGVRP